MIAPSAKTARSVVPPPMSIRHTPSSRSSSARQASAEASGSSTMSITLSPALLAHFTMFWALVTAAVTMWILASRRTPLMPSGSRIPSWSSMMNSCGITWITSRSIGIATALAASITRFTSPSRTSRSLTATTPCELKPRMWPPAMPAKTEVISQSAISSASSTACLMESTVASMSTTTPLRRPREGWVPMPTTSIPFSVRSATITQIFVVPMSSPTIRSS